MRNHPVFYLRRCLFHYDSLPRDQTDGRVRVDLDKLNLMRVEITLAAIKSSHFNHASATLPVLSFQCQ